jgi:cystathionine beta-lyase
VQDRHHEQGRELARWIAEQEGVAAVLHPALPGDPGHDLWRRDFTGAAGLFGVELDPSFGKPHIDAMLDQLRLFGLGHSYGGYESLVVPADPVSRRLPGTWAGRGPLIRVHVGFEALADLKEDLRAGFEALLRGRVSHRIA